MLREALQQFAVARDRLVAVIGVRQLLGAHRSTGRGPMPVPENDLDVRYAYFVVVRISEAQEAKRSAWGRGERSAVPFDPRDAVA